MSVLVGCFHPTRKYPDSKVWVWVPFSCLKKRHIIPFSHKTLVGHPGHHSSRPGTRSKLVFRRPPDYSSNLSAQNICYMTFWGVFWASFLLFFLYKRPKKTQKSYSKCLRRTHIRWVIQRLSSALVQVPKKDAKKSSVKNLGPPRTPPP